MQSSRMKIRLLMFTVAVVAVLSAGAVQVWRWHQRAEFALKYRLGWLVISGQSGADRHRDVERVIQRPGLSDRPR